VSGVKDRPTRRRNSVSVLARAVPVSLVVAAAIADITSAPRLAFYALVIAVPFAALAALAAYGELVDAAEAGGERRSQRVQALCAGVALTLLVIGTAARAPAVGEGVVPPLATSALVLCLAALLVQAVVASTRQIREQVRIPRPELEV
jgi:hypothetical protein